MEDAVQIWQGQLRTIKHFSEWRIGKRVEPGSALFNWLIPFCADILNKFRVGGDGRTAYERIMSYACNVALIDFEKSLTSNSRQTRMTEIDEIARSTRACYWRYDWRSTEYLVASKGVSYKCRTVRRRADDIAFNAARIVNLGARC